MYFKQFYLGCLAHASYLVGDGGEAAVIDPRRDVDEYIAEADAQGLKIKYVIETHLHADFVSGHRELAARTGAKIVFGKKADAAFEHTAVSDGDEVTLGEMRLRFLETPGHTPESISVLVFEKNGETPSKVLTGDTLFVGDVGRPDLASPKGHTPEAMAGDLYESLHGKLLSLPDDTEVYPAHGAGSLCGRNMSKETWSTIGEQRRTNYALREMPRSEFVQMMTADLPEAPRYFSRDAELNRSGPGELADLPPLAAIAPQEVADLEEDGVAILDVREASSFGTAHVPFSINIGLGGQFASWAGCLIAHTDRIVIVADSEERVAEARLRLARVGLENVVGYLDGGIAAWSEAGLPLNSVPQISVSELRDQLAEDSLSMQVLDVRRSMEFHGGHVPGAVNAPLSSLDSHIDRLDPNKPTAVICAGGYRSSAATSLLERHGFTDLLNVTGGTAAWIKAGLPTQQPGAASSGR